MTPLIIKLIIMLACAVIVGFVADGKGRNWLGWALFGFFFTIIAVIVIFIVSDLGEEREKDRRLNQKLDEANTRIRALQREVMTQKRVTPDMQTENRPSISRPPPRP